MKIFFNSLLINSYYILFKFSKSDRLFVYENIYEINSILQ